MIDQNHLPTWKRKGFQSICTASSDPLLRLCGFCTISELRSTRSFDEWVGIPLCRCDL